MTCDEVQDGLVLFHFGELPAEHGARVERHLESCPSCLRAYFVLKRAGDAASDDAGPVPSPALRGRVRAELFPPQPTARLSPRLRLGVAAVAAVLMVVIGLTSLLPGGSTPPRTANLDLKHVDSSRVSPATLEYF